jgi:hypothetical protein
MGPVKGAADEGREDDEAEGEKTTVLVSSTPSTRSIRFGEATAPSWRIASMILQSQGLEEDGVRSPKARLGAEGPDRNATTHLPKRQ